ncbi:hypothetical protein G4B88_007061 [Cannabis sativa]|uniref:Uncharacterized protein n=1 Tax=Cannabis sativa TaxID=3483 RepID=A0A7J6GPB4_CANSA|nr:hypothetical protein G4B88_007061 [Cannabis sativa]
MEAIEESTQLSDSMRQAVALLADEDVDENSTSSSSPREEIPLSSMLSLLAMLIDHVSRSKKSHADFLATIASKIKINDTEVEKEIKVVKRTIPTSFLDVDLIEIAEVFVAEENIDSTEGPKWFEPM